MYKGAMPEFMEFGPYYYREYDVYGRDGEDNKPLQYVGAVPVPGQEKSELPGVNVIFNQYKKPYDVDKYPWGYDTKMWVTSQAANGIWHQATHLDDWRLGINIFFSAAVEGLGHKLASTLAYTNMNVDMTTDLDPINDYIFPNQNLDDDTANKVWNDPYYGLSNSDNFKKWDPLLDSASPMDK